MQSAISNQQSAISNQQSAISNQQSSISNQQIKLQPVASFFFFILTLLIINGLNLKGQNSSKVCTVNSSEISSSATYYNLKCLRGTYLKATDSVVVNVKVYFIHNDSTNSIYRDFTTIQGTETVNSLINYLKNTYKNLALPFCSTPDIDTIISDTRVRFNFNPLTDIHHIYNPAYYIANDNFLLQQTFNPLKNTLNIIFSGNPNGVAPQYNNTMNGGRAEGIGNGSNLILHWVRTGSTFQQLSDNFINDMKGLLVHEVGHLFGLIHTAAVFGLSCDPLVVGDDGLTDTYAPDAGNWRAQSGNQSPVVEINGTVTTCYNIPCTPNNIMGYSSGQNYLSPTQILLIQRNLRDRSFVNKSLSFIDAESGEDLIVENRTLTIDHDNPQTKVKIYRNIVVANGGRLTLKGCFMMAKNGLITVEAGNSLLILDGAEINSIDGMWMGIEVLGNQKYPQQPVNNLIDPNQGTLIVKNNSKIQNAYYGIYVGLMPKPNIRIGNPRASSGGRLFIENSIIERCYTGIYFQGRINRLNTSEVSTVKNTTFNWAGLLRDTTIKLFNKRASMFYGIVLNNCAGVLIDGCTFNGLGKPLLRTVITGNEICKLLQVNKNEEIRGTAIMVANSRTNIRNCNFNDLRDGIKITNANNILYTGTISNNQFTNTLFSIAGSASYTQITNNNFKVPNALVNSQNAPPGTSLYPYGIYLDGASAFRVENNLFDVLFATDTLLHCTTNGGGQTGGGYSTNVPDTLMCFGLIVRNSGVLGGVVTHNNTFNGFWVATQTEGNNPNLKIGCNTYNQNKLAWRVNPDSPNGTLKDQGEGCQTNDYRPKNQFLGKSAGKDNFESYLNNPFKYYGYNDSYLPNLNSGNGLTLINCGGWLLIDPDTSCPSLTYGRVAANTLGHNSYSLWRTDSTSITEQLMAYLHQQDYQSAILLIEQQSASKPELNKLIAQYYLAEKNSKYHSALNNLTNNKAEFRLFKKFLQVFDKSQNNQKISPADLTKLNECLTDRFDFSAASNGILEQLGIKSYNPVPENLSFNLNRQSNNQNKTGELSVAQQTIKIFPNPAQDHLTISLPDNEEVSIIINNLLGQLTFQNTYETASNKVSLSLKNMPEGIYFLTVIGKSSQIRITEKLIIER